MYEVIIKDLEICSKNEACTGCSQEGEGGVPECYQIVMEQAAQAIKHLLEERKDMIPAGKYLSELMQQIRSTVTDKNAYIAGLNAALYIAMAMATQMKEEAYDE